MEIIADQKWSLIIKEAFELFASETYAPQELATIIEQKGTTKLQ